jgi:hypothetical protein
MTDWILQRGISSLFLIVGYAIVAAALWHARPSQWKGKDGS